MLKKDYNSKYFSVLGDSISTLFGYSQPIEAAFYTTANRYQTDVCYPEDTWWGRVISALGGKLLVNDSFSGSAVCYSPLCEIESYGCSDMRTSRLSSESVAPNVIMVFMGINDRGLNAPLRPRKIDCPKNGESGDLTVFSVAYSAMLSKLRANYPEAEIWCLTLPLSNGAALPLARKSSEYSAIIKECAALHNALAIDVGNILYQSADGLHPDRKGMEQLAAAVLQAVGC